MMQQHHSTTSTWAAAPRARVSFHVPIRRARESALAAAACIYNKIYAWSSQSLQSHSTCVSDSFNEGFICVFPDMYSVY